MINPISFQYTYPAYPNYHIGNQIKAPEAVSRINQVRPIDDKKYNQIGKTEQTECKTCKSRKYIDRSDEGNVSFQTPTHVAPEVSRAMVSSHEQEHVRNAVNEGNKAGNELVFASVRLITDICPECGKPYIAGGETRTQIKYDISNPYEDVRKRMEESLLKGLHIDLVA